MDKQQSRRKFSPEVRARAVRMVIEHRGDHASQWAAIVSISAKIGCTAQTLHNWVRQTERDQRPPQPRRGPPEEVSRWRGQHSPERRASPGAPQGSE